MPRVEPRERLIKQDRLRLMQIRATDRHFLSHSARQFLSDRIAFFGQLKLREQSFGLGFKGRQAINRRREFQVLPNCQDVEELRLIRNERQPTFGGDRVEYDVVSGNR